MSTCPPPLDLGLPRSGSGGSVNCLKNGKEVQARCSSQRQQKAQASLCSRWSATRRWSFLTLALVGIIMLGQFSSWRQPAPDRTCCRSCSALRMTTEDLQTGQQGCKKWKCSYKRSSLQESLQRTSPRFSVAGGSSEERFQDSCLLVSGPVHLAAVSAASIPGHRWDRDGLVASWVCWSECLCLCGGMIHIASKSLWMGPGPGLVWPCAALCSCFFLCFLVPRWLPSSRDGACLLCSFSQCSPLRLPSSSSGSQSSSASSWCGSGGAVGTAERLLFSDFHGFVRPHWGGPGRDIVPPCAALPLSIHLYVAMVSSSLGWPAHYLDYLWCRRLNSTWSILEWPLPLFVGGLIPTWGHLVREWSQWSR